MKKILITICTCMDVISIAHADTETINWYVDNSIYDTTTCQTGGDIILPANAPTKYGYTFQGWQSYTPIEYLEFTGTQYIQIPTTYTPLYHHGQIDIVMTDLGTCYQPSIVFFRGTSFFMIEKRFALWTTDSVKNNKTTQLGTKYHVEYISSPSIRSMNVDGTVFSTSGNVSTARYDYIYIGDFFADRVPFCLNAKIYYVKLLDENGDFIVDLIPVLDVYGVPCMYDKVSHQFFYNAGTGDFIAGPVIAE